MFRIISSAILVSSALATNTGFDVGSRVEYCPDDDYFVMIAQDKVVDDRGKDVTDNALSEMLWKMLKNTSERNYTDDPVVTHYGKTYKLIPNADHWTGWTEYKGKSLNKIKHRLLKKRAEMRSYDRYREYADSGYPCTKPIQEDRFTHNMFRLSSEGKWRKATVKTKESNGVYTIVFDGEKEPTKVSSGDYYYLDGEYNNMRREDRVNDAYKRLLAAGLGVCGPREGAGYYNRVLQHQRYGFLSSKSFKSTKEYVAVAFSPSRKEIEERVAEGKYDADILELLADLEQALGDEYNATMAKKVTNWKNDNYRAPYKKEAPEQKMAEEKAPKKPWTCAMLVKAMEKILEPVINATDYEILLAFDTTFQKKPKGGYKYNKAQVFKRVKVQLAHIKAAIKSSSYYVTKVYKKTANPIDLLEAVAINMYTKQTGGTFKIMNYVLRQHNNFSKNFPGDKHEARAAWDKYYHLLLDALKSAPQRKINTYRGVSFGKPEDLYGKHLKSEIVHHDFLSSSTSRGTAWSWAGSGTLFEFTSADKTAADVKAMSAFSHEDEVLISPLIIWKVVAKQDSSSGPTTLRLRSIGQVKSQFLKAQSPKPIQVNGFEKDKEVVYPKPGSDAKVLSKIYGVNPISNELLVAAHPNLIWINGGAGVLSKDNVSPEDLAKAEKPVPLLPGALIELDGKKMMVAHVNADGKIALVNTAEGTSAKIHVDKLDLNTLTSQAPVALPKPPTSVAKKAVWQWLDGSTSTWKSYDAKTSDGIEAVNQAGHGKYTYEIPHPTAGGIAKWHIHPHSKAGSEYLTMKEWTEDYKKCSKVRRIIV